MRLAVRSRISLWRIDGKPPSGQERACSTVKDFPHVQVEGMLDGSQPYLRAIAIEQRNNIVIGAGQIFAIAAEQNDLKNVTEQIQ